MVRQCRDLCVHLWDDTVSYISTAEEARALLESMDAAMVARRREALAWVYWRQRVSSGRRTRSAAHPDQRAPTPSFACHQPCTSAAAAAAATSRRQRRLGDDINYSDDVVLTHAALPAATTTHERGELSRRAGSAHRLQHWR